MRTRVGWLCLVLLVFAMVLIPSLASGGSPLVIGGAGGLLGVKEVVGVPSLVELLGAEPSVLASASPDGVPLAPPRVIPRAAWGAEERLRFVRGRPRTTPTFVPVRKLVIHHTVTPRREPPRPALRRIYHSHTLARGFADIGYHYVVAGDGRVFKGRYSGPRGTLHEDRPWADKRERFAVRGAHAVGANHGTVGVALLGNYEKRPLSPKAREALVDLLAWLADRYGIDPTGTSKFPWGRGVVATPNIAGHGIYGSTACPGKEVKRELPSIRRDVALRLRTVARSRPDVHGPLIRKIRIPRVGRHGAVLAWTTDEPARAVVSVKAEGTEERRTAVRAGLSEHHRLRLGPLRRGTGYVVRIGGADARGNTAWSAPHSLRTRG